jgi:hypothetical protein
MAFTPAITACASGGIAGKGIAVTQHGSSAEYGFRILSQGSQTAELSTELATHNKSSCSSSLLYGSHAMALCGASSSSQAAGV